jgi:ChrR-like protein with cupin domain
MPKPEYEFHTPKGEWRPAAFKSAGIWEKNLAEDPVTGDYSRLVRFEPGADSSADGPFAHEFWEEVYIIEGDLTDLRLNERFTGGMYACRPPGMVHGPWRSEGGVLMVEFRYDFPKM